MTALPHFINETTQSMEFEPMNITKAHLTDSIYKELGLPKSRSFGLVGSLFEIMKAALGSGEDILISGFGKFCVKVKNERRGRNPLTGEDIILRR